jgi:hypothetical protein
MPIRQPQVGDIWKPKHQDKIMFLITDKYFSEETNTHMLRIKNLATGYNGEAHFVFVRDCWEYIA